MLSLIAAFFLVTDQRINSKPREWVRAWRQCQGLQCIWHLAMFSFSKAFGKAHQYLWKRRDESMRPEFAEESKCWKKDEGAVEVGKLYNWMNIRHHFHWHLAWCINWAKNGFSGKYKFGNHSPSVILSFASLLIFDHKRWSCQNRETRSKLCLIKVEPKLWNPVNLCQNRKIVKSSQSHKILPMNWKIWLLVSSHLCKQIGGYLLFAINHQGYTLYSVGAAWAAEKYPALIEPKVL